MSEQDSASRYTPQVQQVYDRLAAGYPLMVARADLLTLLKSQASIGRQYRLLYVLISRVRDRLPPGEWIESFPGVGYRLRRRGSKPSPLDPLGDGSFRGPDGAK